MNHFETNWQSADGLQIFAQGWESTVIQPKAVVCLVHGLGEHSSRYAHVGESLARDGFILFASDLRGHGRSGGVRGHISSIEDFMTDIDLLLVQARTRYPGLPIILYGHSLGGIQVLHYGLIRKPNIKGVIATSPGLHTELEKQQGKVLAAKVLGSLIPNTLLASGKGGADLYCRPTGTLQDLSWVWQDHAGRDQLDLGACRRIPAPAAADARQSRQDRLSLQQHRVRGIHERQSHPRSLG